MDATILALLRKKNVSAENSLMAYQRYQKALSVLRNVEQSQREYVDAEAEFQRDYAEYEKAKNANQQWIS